MGRLVPAGTGLSDYKTKKIFVDNPDEEDLDDDRQTVRVEDPTQSQRV